MFLRSLASLNDNAGVCSLCGVLSGASHWAETARGTPGDTGQRRAALRDRLRRVELLNRVLRPSGLSVDEFEETAYVVRTPTGAAELVPDLAGVWAAAARLRGDAPDPLDPGLLDALEGSCALR